MMPEFSVVKITLKCLVIKSKPNNFEIIRRIITFLKPIYNQQNQADLVYLNGV